METEAVQSASEAVSNSFKRLGQSFSGLTGRRSAPRDADGHGADAPQV